MNLKFSSGLRLVSRFRHLSFLCTGLLFGFLLGFCSGGIVLYDYIWASHVETDVFKEQKLSPRTDNKRISEKWKKQLDKHPTRVIGYRSLETIKSTNKQ